MLIEDLASTESNESVAPSIDIKRIEQLARQSSYKLHFINSLDEDIIIKYCALLSSVVRLTDDTEKKVKQYYFIARILYGNKLTIAFDEIIMNAEMINISDFEFMKQELGADIKVLLFDMLLAISMDGTMDDKQLDYICEVFAYVDLSKKDIEYILKVTSCVLKAEERSLFKYADGFPIAKLSCYLNKAIKCEVVTSWEEFIKSKDKVIIAVGLCIKNTELPIDEYKKKSIRFLNCKFENVSSISAADTKVEFEDCSFLDCQKKYELRYADSISNREKSHLHALFEFNKAEFTNCIFEKCSHINNMEASEILKVNRGHIVDCVFQNCSIGTNSIVKETISTVYRYEYGAIIYAEKVSIVGCEFIRCVSNGNGAKCHPLSCRLVFLGSGENFSSDYQYLHIVYCRGGNIEQCEFSGCECNGLSNERTKRYNYLINSIGALERNNTYSNCIRTNDVGTAEWEIFQ